MKSQFALAGGNVVGTDHQQIKANNQDAYLISSTDMVTVAFVADGCGDRISSPNSEIGAKLGVKIAVQVLLAHWPFLGQSSFWETVEQEILAKIAVDALTIDSNFTRAIIENFLFTLVGVVITPNEAVFVSFGDGIIVVNGKETIIGPFPDNEPPYLAYKLLPTSLFKTSPDSLRFQIHKHISTRELEHFLIGTDGTSQLTKITNELLPGKEIPVGPIEQFWAQDKNFANPFQIGRFLNQVNKNTIKVDWDQKTFERSFGLLEDDTTLIVGKRLQGG